MNWFDPSTAGAAGSLIGIAIGVAISILTVFTLLLNSRTSALKATCDSLDSLRKTLQERVTCLEGDHAALGSEYSKLRALYEKLEHEYAKLKASYDVLQAAHVQAQTVIAGLQASVAKLERENELLRKPPVKSAKAKANANACPPVTPA